MADVIAIAAAWGLRILPQQTNAITLAEVHTKWGPNTTGPDASTAVGSAGSKGGDPYGAQVSALVQKRTAVGGRTGRGRLFLPGLTESLISDGSHLQAGYRTDLQTAFDNFFTDMGALARDLYLLHGGPSAPNALTGFSVELLLATQRRRLRG
jgi:hypothetical protein